LRDLGGERFITLVQTQLDENFQIAYLRCPALMLFERVFQPAHFLCHGLGGAIVVPKIRRERFILQLLQIGCYLFQVKDIR
jgi:hypothetical protein